MNAKLFLEDGTKFIGKAFGSKNTKIGEICFNTSFCGYQEILTDPSYFGQIITFTSPLVGNYGITNDAYESSEIHCFGVVIKELSEKVFYKESVLTLNDFLKNYGIPGIEGVDTRKLTKIIRTKGALKTLITTENLSDSEAFELLEKTENVYLGNLTTFVSRKTVEHRKLQNPKFKVAVYDFGVKENILQNLIQRGCELVIFPAETSYEEILKINPDGIFLSNGPGNPEAVLKGIENIKNLLGKKTIFGICLGHQLLALSIGIETEKLKFGHRGGNHPVKNLETGKIEITPQNHGFNIKESTFDKTQGVKITHKNINDGTIEGIELTELNAFSVQYHPESSPGPNDANYLFNKFIRRMEQAKNTETPSIF
ncbi:glutamine-hydrolyzing carbamoyl-phosphate synthase small subunit [bacterium]|nr:glutamine-hydrolyzing carbamoyl-phosphate synthase small subunit [bacterium]